MIPSVSNIVGIVLVLLAQQRITVLATSDQVVTEHAPVDESHDPYKDVCKMHNGEYYREYSIRMVCCGNETLKFPDILIHEQRVNKAYADCSKKFSKDETSDFPTGLWKAFLCKLEKSNVFKTKGKLVFDELLTFMTQYYPDSVKSEMKLRSTKCKAIDSSKDEDHLKIQKYMECYYSAENTTCHKPYGEIVSHDEDVKRAKELGCPVIPGLMFGDSMEYCCKKRSTPYPVMNFPGTIIPEETWINVDKCQESFAQREKELNPEAFKAPAKKDDSENQEVHTTWDIMCYSACHLERKNYTASMLKLDPDTAIDFWTHDFGKSLSVSLGEIIKRRKNKDKIFISMNSKNKQPMNFAELSALFDKANEKEKIEYYCKFVDTINFEERRAVHEYCFDEKYASGWGELHHF